eukprot:CAMPEP_0117683954 /NCGR_PEP_ID=MMETSP0804-20121206/20767_1 /TAXON_ID=1074897 /ORGANISM="Tetraselmis astigmatica, Strain CCMP880" /LENGTH=678 /DNA_ID=CAMNT_0005494765 /DNA_START=289 /DNA_END=2326 /DNA_ORIENTATION=-
MGCFKFSWGLLRSSPAAASGETPEPPNPCPVQTPDKTSSSRSHQARSATDRDDYESSVHAAMEAVNSSAAALAAENPEYSTDVQLSFSFARPVCAEDIFPSVSPVVNSSITVRDAWCPITELQHSPQHHNAHGYVAQFFVPPRLNSAALSSLCPPAKARSHKAPRTQVLPRPRCKLQAAAATQNRAKDSGAPASAKGRDADVWRLGGPVLHNPGRLLTLLPPSQHLGHRLQRGAAALPQALRGAPGGGQLQQGQQPQIQDPDDDDNTFHFSTAGHGELLQWLQAFSGVPGVYRRAEDYFRIGNVIGRGATCRAFECTSRLTEKDFVLKVRVNSHDMESTRGMHNELRILQKCAPFNHPAIPHLEDYFFDQNGKIAVVMERFYGGELYNRVIGHSHFSERQAHHVFRQIAGGVAFLHTQGIAHRDLKTSNILIRNEEGPPEIAIIDYDLAKINHAEVWEGHTPCGTAPFMAPEIVRHAKYGMAVDMWSLGCVLYVILTGKRPFDGKDNDEIKESITKFQFTLTHEELSEHISELALDLIFKLLQMKPEDRLTSVQCLQHEWVQQDPSKIPDLPLPSPSNLRSEFTEAERKQLSSRDADESYRARDKLNKMVETTMPPEGRNNSRPNSFSVEDELEPATKRNLDIEGLKILLEENDNLHSMGDGAQQEKTAQTPSSKQEP